MLGAVTELEPVWTLLSVCYIKGKCSEARQQHPPHHANLISDFYYTHGMSLRILP